MKLRHLDAPLTSLEAEGLVILRHEGAAPDADFQAIDARTGGMLAAVHAQGDFKGKPAEVLVVQAPGQPVRRVVLAGLGKPGEATLESVRNAAGRGATTLRDLGVTAITVAVPASVDFKAGVTADAEALTQAVAEGARLSLYKLGPIYKKKKDAPPAIDLAILAAASGAKGVETAGILAEAIDFARTLIHHPGNVLTPTRMADEAKAAGEAAGLEVEIFDEQAIVAKGFTGIHTIAKGSETPARFIVMRWNGGKPGDAPIAIVGKGVTFDSGGIGVKPSAGMEKMKYDMAGGAAAIAILLAAAKLKLPVNVVGLVPSVENMMSATAVCPNEIITMYNGMTVEVNDTDAEGRVILADALAYAVKDCGAKAIIDMATLTGAVGIALGREIAGVMGNDQALVDAVLAAGDRAGEKGWQLPMDPMFDEMTKSNIADLMNYPGRDASCITAAAFLKAFVGETPWVHLDIAGVAWTDSDKPYRPKGPTGVPVRSTIEFLRTY